MSPRLVCFVVFALIAAMLVGAKLLLGWESWACILACGFVAAGLLLGAASVFGKGNDW